MEPTDKLVGQKNYLDLLESMSRDRDLEKKGNLLFR